MLVAGRARRRRALGLGGPRRSGLFGGWLLAGWRSSADFDLDSLRLSQAGSLGREWDCRRERRDEGENDDGLHFVRERGKLICGGYLCLGEGVNLVASSVGLMRCSGVNFLFWGQGVEVLNPLSLSSLLFKLSTACRLCNKLKLFMATVAPRPDIETSVTIYR